MIGRRIKQLRLQHGMTQKELAEKISLTPKMISFYELEGRFPPNDVLGKLAGIFDVSTDYILGRTEQENAAHRAGVLIPVLGGVPVGIPTAAIEDILDCEEISHAMAAQGEHFGLRIQGTSMEPRMREGDVVIVRKQEDADSGDTVVATVDGGEATVKKLKKGRDGISLVPTNPVCDPTFYTNAEVRSLPVCIIGKVVELRAKY